MNAKQVNAQAIFAGLTEGDFEKVERHAAMLYGTGILEGWLADRKFDQAHGTKATSTRLSARCERSLGTLATRTLTPHSIRTR